MEILIELLTISVDIGNIGWYHRPFLIPNAFWHFLESTEMKNTATAMQSDLDPSSPILFTDAAAAKVRALIAEENNDALMLRVYVTGGGCSGFQYGFAFEEELSEGDTRIEKGGVTLVIDPMSFQYLVGAEIDYTEGLEGAHFVIRNPNAVSTCGCGSSFSA